MLYIKYILFIYKFQVFVTNCKDEFFLQLENLVYNQDYKGEKGMLKFFEKNKKIIISMATAIIILCGLAATYSYAGGIMDKKEVPSDYKIGITYDEAVKSDRPMIALFYVDWCGYCMRFMPKYKTLEKIYKDQYNLVMINAENPDMKNLVEDAAITGYPTMYILDPKYNNKIHLTNGIYGDLKKLRVEFDRYLRIRDLLDKKS